MAKLNSNDVAKIKFLILQGELTQKQIGEQFGVASQQISRIKTGKRWAEVEIDDNGNHIQKEIEIVPENFKVNFVEDEPETVNIVDDESSQYRVKFINDYFHKKKGGVYPHYEPTAQKSKRFIGALWNSYKWLFNNEYNDFISEVMMATTEKVMTFEPKDKDFNWEYVKVAGTKEHLILNDNINKAIKTAIIEYANKINNSYKVESNGEISWMKPIVESIDVVNNNGEGDFPLIEELPNEMNLFHMKNDYFGSQFLDWFSGEHLEFLTDGQIRFLNTTKYFQRDRDDNYVIPFSQLPDECKPYSQQAIDHNKRRIRMRTEEEYLKVEKLSLRELYDEKELKLLQGFIDIVEIDDDRIHKQNELLSKWLMEHIDNQFVEDILFEMDSDGILEIRTGSMSNMLLYKIAEMVEERVAYLESLK
ncbi:hypothetical protein NSQ77_19920 [Oceanobacillus sp. FSL K6-2867]|uniref:hypothetical protein n=1 Tax=Oceanobacillus sp. FSL K6-2867 TaxID=2954748 RepID=UPI0030D9B4D4